MSICADRERVMRQQMDWGADLPPVVVAVRPIERHNSPGSLGISANHLEEIAER
jgi:hypothetical protein